MLLEGARQRYTEMFMGLPLQDENVRDRISKALDWCLTVLKKQDRIVWYLKFVRYYLDVAVTKANRAEQSSAPWFARLQGRIKQFEQFYEKEAFQPEYLMKAALQVQSRQFHILIEHFFSLNLIKLDQVVWSIQVPDQITKEYERIEEAWKAERAQWIDMSKAYPEPESDVGETPEIIMEFPDGFAWWDLHRSYCKVEGDAMGHCGNSAARDGTVLSLRHRDPERPDDSNRWRPVATFILHDDGRIGEMKGRGNKKPAPRYHPYIVALLRDDRITGIKGGGHAPGQNFHVYDLEDEEERDQLLADKPDLAQTNFETLYARYKSIAHPEFKKAVGELASRTGNRVQPYDYDTFSYEDGQGNPTTNVLMELIASNWDDYVAEIGNYVPMVEVLVNLKADLGETLKFLKNDAHDKVELETVEEFYQALSDEGRAWVDRAVQAPPSTSQSSTLHMQDIADALRAARPRELAELFDKAASRLVSHLDKDAFSEDTINARIKTYVDEASSYFLSNYYSHVHEQDGEYFVALPLTYYLDFLNEASASVDDQNYENGDVDIYRILNDGWFSSEEFDNGQENLAPRLAEQGLTELLPKPSDGSYHSEYQIKYYQDAVYGDGTNMPGAIPPVELAREFEQMLFHGKSRTGPQDDEFNQNRKLNLRRGRMSKGADKTGRRFTEELEELRRRAGLI